MTRPRLLLVDDHALFRQSLSNLLTYRGAFEVVGEAANGRDAIAQAGVLRPDIVLMDIDMPVLDGIQATRELILLQPDICIVMLTVFDDQDRLFDAIRAGARGYLVKSIRSHELLEQLQGLVRGEAAISRRMAARILEEFRNLEQQAAIMEPDGGLSSREVQVLELVADRLSNKEIAEQLLISEHTVKNHLKHILAKLQLNNRRQAAAYAVARGWVQPRDRR